MSEPDPVNVTAFEEGRSRKQNDAGSSSIGSPALGESFSRGRQRKERRPIGVLKITISRRSSTEPKRLMKRTDTMSWVYPQAGSAGDQPAAACRPVFTVRLIR